MYTIMGVLVNQRSKKAPDVQEVLTKAGCIIKVRLGLHEASDNACSEEGLILLQLTGSREENQQLQNDLNAIPGVKAEKLEISL